ncbi:MAG: ATP-binding cassette domain-containing protein [Allosphingosinicella sp.]
MDLIFEDDRCHCLVGINGVGKTAFLLSLTRRNALLREDGSWQPATYISPRELISAEGMRVSHFAGLFRPALRLENWGLESAASQAVQSLSQGEKTRLALAVAGGLSPQVLLLDEPTLGLDQGSQALLGDLIALRVARRWTTILTSHDLSAFDTDGSRIIHMRREDGETKVLDAADRMLKGEADVRLTEGTTLSMRGSAAAMARQLLAMQIARLQ